MTCFHACPIDAQLGGNNKVVQENNAIIRTHSGFEHSFTVTLTIGQKHKQIHFLAVIHSSGQKYATILDTVAKLFAVVDTLVKKTPLMCACVLSSFDRSTSCRSGNGRLTQGLSLPLPLRSTITT